jgi:hypothetical protein
MVVDGVVGPRYGGPGLISNFSTFLGLCMEKFDIPSADARR